MTSRRENIKAIADGCRVAIAGGGRAAVTYREYGAVYSISGTRPEFIRSRVMVPAGMMKFATNQFIIDGMRLAAQREIDKRTPQDERRWYPLPFTFRPAVDLPSVQWLNNYENQQKAKPTNEPEHIRDLAVGIEIARLAKLSFSELAVEYRKQVERADPSLDDGWDRALASDYADMIDDIACMRFGSGFYTP